MVDLNKVKEDKLPVTLITPKITDTKLGEAVYCMPKIVPGTYSIYDFGRFLSEFKAFDVNGKELNVKQLDENRWAISQPTNLHKITYWVEDTYDTDQKNVVFEPAGTNIEEKKNFIINTHGFFGYLEGMKRNDYELTFAKPEGFYGATSLVATQNTPTTEKFLVEDYSQLVDAPMMFAVPDTTVMKVGGADVLVAVYSPNKRLTSQYVADNIKDILAAQKEYLGGSLPVNRYAFIIYLFEGMSRSGAMGALEHSYSSLYSLPEMEPQDLTQFIKDVAAHEFFHIVTPLSIHSEQIHDFDFINPQMSQHLWLYEGVIEYFAGHVQVKYDLMPPDQYLKVLHDKIQEAKTYKDKLPFTVMSKGCLHEHKNQYQNVYAKGALIGMCIDIKLRQLSEGKYGVQNLMRDLAKEYGKEKPFKDEELFDKITQLTFPEMRKFFTDYIEGVNPLPLKELFKAVGVLYDRTTTTTFATLGNISLTLDENKVVISDTKNMNAFGKKMGYQEGDAIVQLNEQNITPENASEIIEQYRRNTKEGEKVTVVVERKSGSNTKTKKLKGKALTSQEELYVPLAFDPQATPEQLKLREAWLKAK